MIVVCPSQLIVVSCIAVIFPLFKMILFMYFLSRIVRAAVAALTAPARSRSSPASHHFTHAVLVLDVDSHHLASITMGVVFSVG